MLRPHKNIHMQNALNAYAYLKYPNWVLDQPGHANAHTSPHTKHVSPNECNPTLFITQYHDMHNTEMGD